jgi:hypothetical protein
MQTIESTSLRLLTLKQTCDLIGVSPATLRLWRLDSTGFATLFHLATEFAVLQRKSRAKPQKGGFAMAENERKEEEILAQLPELEIPCDNCKGSGIGGGAAGQCVLCGGSGYETTEFGEKVLRLMRHNLRPLFRELIRGE